MYTSLCRPTRPIPPGMCLADRRPKIPPQITRSDQIFHPGSLCLDALAGVRTAWLCSCGTWRRGGRVGVAREGAPPVSLRCLVPPSRGAGSFFRIEEIENSREFFPNRNTELSPFFLRLSRNLESLPIETQSYRQFFSGGSPGTLMPCCRNH